MATGMRKVSDVAAKPNEKKITKKTIIDENYKTLTLTELRKAYEKLAIEKQKLEDGAFCHSCNKHLNRDKFYRSTTTASGLVPVCKACLFKIATNYDEKTKEVNETEESLKAALKIADRPFLRNVYDSSYKAIYNEASGKQRGYVWGQYITLVSSLDQWSSLTWNDSDEDVLLEDDKQLADQKKATKRMREFWGNEFTDKDLIFLDREYNDWVTRHECQTKSQEEVFKRICFKQLEIYKATLNGESTKDLDKTFQDLLDTGNLKPKNNSLDTLSNAQTMGLLIDKWENERPLPEIDEELKDVDKLGLMLDVFFRGHMAKLLNIKNPLSHLYEKYMAKYTVNRPEYADEEDNELLFEKIFGSQDSD